jgi:hypothetical protein
LKSPLLMTAASDVVRKAATVAAEIAANFIAVFIFVLFWGCFVWVVVFQLLRSELQPQPTINPSGSKWHKVHFLLTYCAVSLKLKKYASCGRHAFQSCR